MKKNNIYTLLSFLVCALGLQAQVMLKMPDLSAKPGDNVSVDVKVENFVSITGLQFSISWDKNVLKYLGVGNFGLPDMTADGNFGTIDANNGKLRFVWYQSDLSGVTLSNMATIFSINFKVIGGLNTSTQLVITNEPIVIEVISTTGPVPHGVDNGILVVGTSTTQETITPEFILFQNNPNPFTEITWISFQLQQNTQAELNIFDPTGKIIYRQNANFAAGLNKIPLTRDIFQGAGSYLYTLKTDRSTATRQLIVQ